MGTLGSMSALGDHLETRSAVLRVNESGMIEQRFKEGADLDTTMLSENRDARLAICDGDTYGLYCVLPTEMSIPVLRLGSERYGEGEEEGRLKALAIVAEDDKGHTMASVYSKYFNFSFPVRVFEQAAAEEAKAWLRLHLS